MTYLWASPERSGWVCGFSAIIAKKNLPQKKFGSRKMSRPGSISSMTPRKKWHSSRPGRPVGKKVGPQSN